MPSSHLLLGRAVRAWGLDGAVKVEPYADLLSVVAELGHVYLDAPESGPVGYGVDSVRRIGASWVLKLRGVESPEEARRLVGREIAIPRSSAPVLPEGAYYHGDLIGLRVVDEGGRELGRIAEIWETGANDVYVLRGRQGESLVPATREVVKRIDLASGIMVVHPLKGMIESEAL
jgi:16S rRNA processing protein RimM